MDVPADLADDPYYHLAQTGPYAPAIGAALITMVEPHVGHEHAYNRWYEDDHYNAGAMAFPWMWAGRRWVAPVPYQNVRYPADSSIAQPLEAGKYISAYWITDGQYEHHLRWAVGTNHRLFADERVYLERDHTFTSFQRYRGPIYRDADGPRDIHALDYPYGGLVVEVIDAPDADAREQLLEWLARAVPPTGSPVAMGTALAPMPLPADKQPRRTRGGRHPPHRPLVHEGTADVDEFAGRRRPGHGIGLGRVELMAPFIPTLPGTDWYVATSRGLASDRPRRRCGCHRAASSAGSHVIASASLAMTATSRGGRYD
jgi:hypothetical protein